MKYVSQDADNKPRFVESGDYLVTVIEAHETVSKETGADMIKLKLEVEGHGVTLFDYLVAAESSFWKIDTFLKAIGDTVVEGQEVELFAADLEGRQGYAHLRVEEYDGKQNNKVDMWLTGNVPLQPKKDSVLTTAPQPESPDEDVPF